MLTVVFTLASCIFTILIYVAAGGEVVVLIQPFLLMLILGLILGSALASGRIGVWGSILLHLRGGTEIGVDAKSRQRCTEMLATLRSAEITAQIAGAVGAVLGIVHAMGSVTEPPEVLGHLIGGALVSVVYGLMVANLLIAPIGDRLASKFDRELAAKETLRA